MMLSRCNTAYHRQGHATSRVDKVVECGKSRIQGEGVPVPAMNAPQYIDNVAGISIAKVISVAPVVTFNRYLESHYYGLNYRDIL